MSKRNSAAAANAAASKEDGPVGLPSMSPFSIAGAEPRERKARPANTPAASDKQKVLLSTDTGHFSLVRAMHLADLITELNGEQPSAPTRGTHERGKKRKETAS
jgi:CDP-diacylglycerol--serine O-phosphatidyltransferase